MLSLELLNGIIMHGILLHVQCTHTASLPPSLGILCFILLFSNVIILYLQCIEKMSCFGFQRPEVPVSEKNQGKIHEKTQGALGKVKSSLMQHMPMYIHLLSIEVYSCALELQDTTKMTYTRLIHYKMCRSHNIIAAICNH